MTTQTLTDLKIELADIAANADAIEAGLLATLEASAEILDTIEAYHYLAEWERGMHRGDDEYNVGDHLRLRPGHRVPQTQE